MSGINWDIVTVQCQQKSADFAKAHPNFTVEAAYYAGYMECAAERESLRVINARLEKERLNTPPVVPATAVIATPPLVGTITPAPSMLGSFM
jgi:hypothetical protein